MLYSRMKSYAVPKILHWFDWFDLSVYYDLSSVQIHKALYKFLKSHWLYYNIDYVNKDALKKLTERWQFDLHIIAVVALFELDLSYKTF